MPTTKPRCLVRKAPHPSGLVVAPDAPRKRTPASFFELRAARAEHRFAALVEAGAIDPLQPPPEAHPAEELAALPVVLKEVHGALVPVKVCPTRWAWGAHASTITMWPRFSSAARTRPAGGQRIDATVYPPSPAQGVPALKGHRSLSEEG